MKDHDSEGVDPPSAEAKQIAINFTLEGIKALKSNAERELAELDELDALLGKLGSETRKKGRQSAQHNYKVALEAEGIRARRAAEKEALEAADGS